MPTLTAPNRASRGLQRVIARWPRTILGNSITFVIALIAGAILVQLAMALSGPVVWSLVTIALVVPLGLYLRHEKIQRSHDNAMAGAPSFGDAINRRRTRDLSER